MKFKGLAAIFLVSVISGCATSQFNAEERADGKYILGKKVEVSGVLTDIAVYDSNGAPISSLTQAVSEVSADSSFLAAASQATGLSSLQGGLLGGVVSSLAEVISASTRPQVKALVYDPKKDATAAIPIHPDRLRMVLEVNCLRVNDDVNVYKQGGEYRIVLERTEWMRRNDFDSSCEELRAVEK